MPVEAASGWRSLIPPSVRPYTEAAPIAALFLGISSGMPYAMIAATLTTRLSQDGITKSSITAFALAFLVYNLKFLWAWVVDGVYLPVIGRLGQRVSWLVFTGALVVAAVFNLALVDPAANLGATAVAAVLVAVAGASFDIVIDAYRIESLEPRQLGVGSGMSQYGWRIGSAAAGAVALYLAVPLGWDSAYMICAAFALPAVLVGLILGEPARHRDPIERRSLAATVEAIVGPFREFLQRSGAWLVLLFILVHKVGDTLANLTFRLLFDDLGFSNAEIANYDVLFGFIAYLVGIFIGGILYTRLGMMRSVLLSLWLMAISNLSFAGLAAVGHSNLGLAAAIGFENVASGYGGVVVVAYFSALCDLRYTAAHYALISAAASIVGRVLTGTTAGSLIDLMGYVNFYLLTTLAAMPGIVFFWLLMKSGLIDKSMGTAATTPVDTKGGGP
ncbi:MAG TPA: MFS transporter [Gammaproteobacteria bacterium]|nr:MFS transporter [Gammaproteobacteria bacterium]